MESGLKALWGCLWSWWCQTGNTGLKETPDVCGVAGVKPAALDLRKRPLLLRASGRCSNVLSIADTIGRTIYHEYSAIYNHNITVSRIAKILGSEEDARKDLSRCRYVSDMGHNDYLNNYFIEAYETQLEHKLNDDTHIFNHKLKKLVKKLINSPNRRDYVILDGAHFTEAIRCKRQSPKDAYPYDISELAKLKLDDSDAYDIIHAQL
ncbi:hypothetical protein SADUNF_Sadunf18G0071200 [Salix dunnii]|uniref:Uncharacterized protein n=1 Tax=Salix dunnii TaxID=1413687 RepID=A0A835MDW3_9ROSI|nr:hypothetical protein SADUNF_Sadunf18G0071200 [Salix dunnii]